MTAIEKYLRSCRELVRLCSCNGWIDSESLHFSIIRESGHEIFVIVEFDELLMEGSGSIGNRIPCTGQMHLFLNQYGQVMHAEIL